MSQWTKAKFKQRGPPPALFVQSSPAASSVSLAGAGDAGAGPTGATATSGLGLSNTPSGGSLTAGMPSLPTLSRTASRFLTDAGGSGAPGSTVMSPTAEHAAGPADAALSVSGMSGMTGMTGTSGGTTAAGASGTGAAATFTLPLPLPPLRQAPSTRATDRTDALWAEMQATLEEVELSASEGTRVFGPDHDHKLAALRDAQIALAQAWARSEAEEAGTAGASAAGADDGELLAANNLLRATTTTATSVSAGARDDESASGGANKTAGFDDSAGNASRDKDRDRERDRDNNQNSAHTGNPSSSAAGGGGRPLEQETQVDILLARKRREANDRYFQRVNQGVLDAVAKLEDVASAMRAVEQESVDIWGGASASGGGGDNESEPRRTIPART